MDKALKQQTYGMILRPEMYGSKLYLAQIAKCHCILGMFSENNL